MMYLDFFKPFMPNSCSDYINSFIVQQKQVPNLIIIFYSNNYSVRECSKQLKPQKTDSLKNIPQKSKIFDFVILQYMGSN